MQTATFRIWTRMAKSISYDDNSYIKHASIFKQNTAG